MRARTRVCEIVVTSPTTFTFLSRLFVNDLPGTLEALTLLFAGAIKMQK